MIPNHLQPFITEAIASGLREPEEILRRAVERCNSLCVEMVQNQSDRAQRARKALTHGTYAAIIMQEAV